MYRWMAVGGLVWLGAIALFVMGLRQPAPPREAPLPARPSALVRTLNQSQEDAGRPWWAWRVTAATTALGTMTVEVETERVTDARSIAAQVVEPVRTHGYDEILIYVRRPGSEFPQRRIQWTPQRGFVELIMGD